MIILLLLLTFNFVHAQAEESNKPFVIGKLSCQLGNNLFQVAATCAFAWDHDADPYFPDLLSEKDSDMAINYSHVLFRCNAERPKGKVSKSWKLPKHYNLSYFPIPYTPNMSIQGTFQSEKYFSHYRSELLELFAPGDGDLAYIKDVYGDILAHPNTVGVQLRWFGVKKDAVWWPYLTQYGYDYFQKAMELFPNALFVISTNDIEFARKNIPEWVENVIFLEGEPHYIDFFILSMCKHNIISNSSFGWWAAWLNKNPNKVVVVPRYWINPQLHSYMSLDEVYPKEWIQLDTYYEKPQNHIKKITRSQY